MSEQIRCKMTIEGPKEILGSIEELLQGNTQEVLDFNKVIPMPKEYKKLARYSVPYMYTAVGEYMLCDTTELLGKADPVDGVTVREDIKRTLHPSLGDTVDSLSDKELIKTYIEGVKEETLYMSYADWIKLCLGSYALYKKFGYVSMRDWQLHRWGCLSNAYESSCAHYGNTDGILIALVYSFFTTFDRPIPVVEKLHSMYPDVILSLDFASSCLGEFVGGVTYYPHGKRQYEWDNHSKEACMQALKIFDRDYMQETLVKQADGSWYVE